MVIGGTLRSSFAKKYNSCIENMNRDDLRVLTALYLESRRQRQCSVALAFEHYKKMSRMTFATSDRRVSVDMFRVQKDALVRRAYARLRHAMMSVGGLENFATGRNVLLRRKLGVEW